MSDTSIHSIVGRTIVDVEQTTDVITFTFDNGLAYRFKPKQGSGEEVWIEYVNGIWPDLLDATLTAAEERTGKDSGDLPRWTFYTFRTVKGRVYVRWLGASVEHGFV